MILGIPLVCMRKQRKRRMQQVTPVVSPKAKAATGVTGAVDVAEDPHQMARVTTWRLVHPDLALTNDGEVALCQKLLALTVIWRKTAELSCITSSRSRRGKSWCERNALSMSKPFCSSKS